MSYLRYFYNIFEEQNLEPTSHYWFKRSFWPKDFNGAFEEYYYKESMDKRIKKNMAYMV